MGIPWKKIAHPQLPGEKIEARHLSVVKIQTNGGQYQAVAGEKNIAKHPQSHDREDKQGVTPVEGIPQMIVEDVIN